MKNVISFFLVIISICFLNNSYAENKAIEHKVIILKMRKDIYSSESVKALNKKYRVSRITLINSNNLSMEDLKKKFPARAKRIPKDAKLPEPGFIYRLELKELGEDITKVCEKYRSSSDVIFAQPEHIVQSN